MRFTPLKHQKPEAHIRLYCFPYAGGSAHIFLPWNALTTADIEIIAVQYPGRSTRFNEPLIDNCTLMAKAIAAEINAESSKPFAILGYSMGAVIAYETLRHLNQRPQALFLCASQPPRFPSNHRYKQSDEQMIEDIRKLGGVDERLLQDAEMRSMIINMMRADFKLLDTYEASSQKLNLPVHIIYGENDSHVTPLAAKSWANLCGAPIFHHEIKGGHFFIRSHRDELINYVQHSLLAEEILDELVGT